MAPVLPSRARLYRLNISAAATCPRVVHVEYPSPLSRLIAPRRGSSPPGKRSCIQSGTELHLYEMCWLMTCSEAHVNTFTWASPFNKWEC